MGRHVPIEDEAAVAVPTQRRAAPLGHRRHRPRDGRPGLRHPGPGGPRGAQAPAEEGPRDRPRPHRRRAVARGHHEPRAAAALAAAPARRAALALRRHRLHAARQPGAQAGVGAQGALEGLRRRRRAADPGARGVRHRRPGHRLHPRADGDALHRRARPGRQGREDHRHPEEHRLRGGLGRPADPLAHPRQVRGRHRDPQLRQGDRLPRRRPPLGQRPQRPPPDGRRARQGRGGRLRGRQPRQDAAPARRRRHRLRQVELHQLDDHLAADALPRPTRCG